MPGNRMTSCDLFCAHELTIVRKTQNDSLAIVQIYTQASPGFVCLGCLQDLNLGKCTYYLTRERVLHVQTTSDKLNKDVRHVH